MARHEKVRVLGASGSPYTRKLLGVLRYRHIPYELTWGSHSNPPADLPQPKVKLLPTVYFSSDNGDVEAAVDTTPLIRRFERAYERRSLIPDQPELCFYNDLLEDYGDEWLTKIMFHYRWYHAPDRKNAGPMLVFWNDPSTDDVSAKAMSDALTTRQHSRLYVVGSNEQTASIIERSYVRFLEILDTLVADGGYVLGKRPASCDFAVYGQLTQLGQVEPTSAAIMSRVSKRVRAWLDRMEDLSGVDGDALTWPGSDDVRTRLAPLLSEIGKTYVPFLLANAQAMATEKDTVKTSIDGETWTQPTFPYQAKCLQELGKAYSALPDADQRAVSKTLSDAGCEDLISAFMSMKGA